MPNFACRGHKLKQHDKQERIRVQLKKNEKLALEAKEKQFDLDKLLTIRNNMEKADAIFKVRDYVLSRNNDPGKKTLANIQKFEALTNERNKIKTNVSVFKKLQSDLKFDVPKLFDPNAKSTFDKIHSALKTFADSSIDDSEPDPTNNDVQHQLTDEIQILKEIIAKGDEAIQELLKYTFKTEIGNLKDNVLMLSEEYNNDVNYFDMVQKYSKFVKRSTSKTSRYKVNSFFVCGDAQIMKHLISIYPNVFTTGFKTWNRGTMMDDPPPYHTVSSQRINIIPDISYISPDISDGKYLILDTNDYAFDNIYQFQIYKRSKTIQFSSFFEFEIMDYFSGNEVQYQFDDDLYVTEELTFEEFVDKGITPDEKVNDEISSKL